MDNQYFEGILEEVNRYQETKRKLNWKLCMLYKERQTKEVCRKIAHINSELAKIRRPLSHGKEYAANAWALGKKYAQDAEPVLDHIGVTWTGDFLSALREAGARTFLFKGSGVNGFEVMLAFVDHGCRFDGFASKESDDPSLKEDEQKIRGIRFLV